MIAATAAAGGIASWAWILGAVYSNSGAALPKWTAALSAPESTDWKGMMQGFEATVDTSVAGDLSSMPGLPLGTLAWLCELEPACAGFTDSGALAMQVTTTEPQSGTTLYVKLP